MSELLTRRAQVAVKNEAVKGTFETALDAAVTAKTYADFFSVGVTWTQTPRQETRDIRTPTLAMAQPFYPGFSEAEITFTVELAGHNDSTGSVAATEPPVSRLFDGCGMLGQLVNEWAITSYDTGSIFEHGESVSSPTPMGGLMFGSAAEDVNILPGTGRLWMTTVTGTPTAATVMTGARSGSTATMGTYVINGDWGVAPISGDSSKTLSIVFIQDQVAVKIKGARGTFVVRYPVLGRPTVTFTFKGILHAVESVPQLLTGTNAPTINHQTPNACVGMGLLIDPVPGGTATAVAPCFSVITIDSGNEVSLHDCGNSASGWDYAKITSRNPKMTIDMDLTDVEGWESNFEVGRAHHVVFHNGITDNGNRWECRIPAAVLESLSLGDRDGIANYAATFGLFAGQGPSNAIGEDSEFVFINR